MEVNRRYTIAFRGLKNGVHDFRFDVGGALFRAYDNADIRDAACTADVRMERAETVLALDVAIRGRVVVACDRCLDDCDIPIDFSGRLLVKFSEEEREYDGEVLWLYPGEGEVDLTQYIYESIVLSLPYRRVHPDGACDPAMLERFRIVSEREFAEIEAEAAEPSASAATEAADPAGRGSGWARLAALRERMESEEAADAAPEPPAGK